MLTASFCCGTADMVLSLPTTKDSGTDELSIRDEQFE